MLAIISEQKAETEANIANLRQKINQNQDHVDSRLNTISGEVRSNIQVWESQMQSVKQTNNSEIMRINKAIINLEAKITTGVANNNMTAIEQTAMARSTTVGQMDSTEGTAGSRCKWSQCEYWKWSECL
jgi:cell division septum initiation protein DivIVA